MPSPRADRPPAGHPGINSSFLGVQVVLPADDELLLAAGDETPGRPRRGNHGPATASMRPGEHKRHRRSAPPGRTFATWAAPRPAWAAASPASAPAQGAKMIMAVVTTSGFYCPDRHNHAGPDGCAIWNATLYSPKPRNHSGRRAPAAGRAGFVMAGATTAIYSGGLRPAGSLPPVLPAPLRGGQCGYCGCASAAHTAGAACEVALQQFPDELGHALAFAFGLSFCRVAKFRRYPGGHLGGMPARPGQ